MAREFSPGSQDSVPILKIFIAVTLFLTGDDLCVGAFPLLAFLP